MSVIDPFSPVGASVTVSATNSSAANALTNPWAGITAPTGALQQGSPPQSRVVRVYNAAAVVAFIEFGISTIAATVAASLPIPPGAVEYFEIGPAVTHVATILPSGTGTVYFTQGLGS